MIPASTCSKLHCGLARTSLVARAGQKARHFAPSAARWGETGCVGGSDVEQAKLTHDWAQPIFGWHHGKKGMRDKSRWQVGERKGERIGKVRSGAAAQRRSGGGTVRDVSLSRVSWFCSNMYAKRSESSSLKVLQGRLAEWLRHKTALPAHTNSYKAMPGS